MTDEAVDLARKILDTRLALTRLRQAHPHPRLTVPSAEMQLDKQVEEMQTLEEQLQGLNEKIDGVKEKVKTGARDVERLRVQRADLEKQVRASQTDVEDTRVIGLYDWYVRTYHGDFTHLTFPQVHRFSRSSRASPLPRILPIPCRE